LGPSPLRPPRRACIVVAPFWRVATCACGGDADCVDMASRRLVIPLMSLGMYLKAEYTVCGSRCGMYLLYAARRASSSFFVPMSRAVASSAIIHFRSPSSSALLMYASSGSSPASSEAYRA